MSVVAQDRTNEFRGAVTSLTRIQGGQKRAQPTAATPRSEFSVKASAIAKEIASTTEMLQRLAQLAKRKPLFDDKPVEITELTQVIKQKLSTINDAIKGLQQHAKQETVGWSSAQNRTQLADHSKNVVVMLQGKLGEVTTGFTEVLEARTKKMQQSRERTEQYIPSNRDNTPDNPLYATSRSATPAMGAKPHQSQNQSYSENPFSYASSEPEMLTLPQQQQSLTMAQLEDQQSSYLSSRSVAVEAIESTINELGTIFSQLSTMVAEQRETVQRIDANTEDIAINMGGAQRELLKYYARVSSNRWLIVKSFGVILFFFLLWVLIS